MSPDVGDAPAAWGAARRGEWALIPGLAYLNHGGFGLTPLAVLAAADAWRRRIEENPTRFMAREVRPASRAAAARVGARLGAEGDDIVFSDNATTAVNAVLRSLRFHPGDEILTTGLGYNAVRNTVRYVAELCGAKAVEVPVPLPVADADAIVAAVASRLSARTRLVVLDHIASHSAIALPLARLIPLARQVGARVLIDGAHVPGQMPLDLRALGADYYAANLHKWYFAPRGTAILWARRELQAELHPQTISHGLGQGFHAEFDWTGTRDPSAWLAAPTGIEFHERLGGERLMARNRDLAQEMGRMLAQSWGTPLAAPESLFAAMTVVALPLAGAATQERAIEVRNHLSEVHKIEAAVNAMSGRLWVRIAAQAYNEPAEYERLRDAVRSLHSASR
ncbi:MAG TPA: aminotransferase class V-fold PLP-dependent enzyme [Stellaceae bacterium]|nr:aminotransferase class V-fold PLP-dependent enzyme [Stellaceae bacterium]